MATSMAATAPPALRRAASQLPEFRDVGRVVHGEDRAIIGERSLSQHRDWLVPEPGEQHPQPLR